jgi:hypothetical protein
MVIIDTRVWSQLDRQGVWRLQERFRACGLAKLLSILATPALKEQYVKDVVNRAIQNAILRGENDQQALKEGADIALEEGLDEETATSMADEQLEQRRLERAVVNAIERTLLGEGSTRSESLSRGAQMGGDPALKKANENVSHQERSKQELDFLLQTCEKLAKQASLPRYIDQSLLPNTLRTWEDNFSEDTHAGRENENRLASILLLLLSLQPHGVATHAKNKCLRIAIEKGNTSAASILLVAGAARSQQPFPSDPGARQQLFDRTSEIKKVRNVVASVFYFCSLYCLAPKETCEEDQSTFD